MSDLARDLREALQAETAWRRIARPSQLAPEGDWRTWLVLAGRGWGKTRSGAEWLLERVATGKSHRAALIAPTAADVRDVAVEGPSGILTIAPDSLRPLYEPSKRRLTFPGGAIISTYSADEPERLRGPQHDTCWADELATWRYPEAWDQMLFGLRIGPDPRVCVTTTPKPTKLIRELVASPTTHVTRGSTYENVGNLAEPFLRSIVGKYAGTRLGRQELDAEILDDVEGALWQREQIDRLRVADAPELVRIVVAIDPAVTSGEDADETGIVVAGKGADGHGYILADLSGHYSPDGWARRAVGAYATWQADRIVGEANQGGEMVEATVRTVGPNVAYSSVHASRGKRTRAEPIAALYEQGRVHHVGSFPALEDQLCAALPEGSSGPDDRLDALVWACTELGLAGGEWAGADLAHGLGAWICPTCHNLFVWSANRPCPKCGTPAAATYDEPLDYTWESESDNAA